MTKINSRLNHLAEAKVKQMPGLAIDLGKVPTPADLDLEAKAIAAQMAEIESRQAQLEEQRRQAAELLRSQKVDARDEALRKAQNFRELAVATKDSDAAVNLLAKAKDCEAEAAALAADLGIAPEAEPVADAEPRKKWMLSSTKGIYSILILALITGALFYLTGTSLVTNDENDSAVRMMNSVGLRLLTNFLPFSLAFLAAISILYLLFPSQYAYWHNQIKSPFSLNSDLEKVEPWQRIAFFSFCVFVPIWAFVQLMQVIFG